LAPWGGLVLALALVAATIAWDRCVLMRSRRVVWLVPALLLPLAMPLTIPQEWVYARALVTVWAITMAGKGYELLRDRVPDPRMLARLPTFCFWLLVPPKAELSADPAAAVRVQTEGLGRLGRAVLKLPFVGALLLVHLYWPGLHEGPWIEAFWGLWLTYLAVSGFVDVLSGLAMQTGIAVAESFDVPPLARSPREFWGRRWNLVVSDLVFRHVFLPVGGLRRPVRATAWVFVISGLLHELFVLFVLGHPARHAGFMMIFFGLHGLAVMVQLAWDRGRRRRRRQSMARPLAVALHLLWMTLTAPLFFAPIGEIFS
jgi:hypothetical protein